MRLLTYFPHVVKPLHKIVLWRVKVAFGYSYPLLAEHQDMLDVLFLQPQLQFPVRSRALYMCREVGEADLPWAHMDDIGALASVRSLCRDRQSVYGPLFCAGVCALLAPLGVFGWYRVHHMGHDHPLSLQSLVSFWCFWAWQVWFSCVIELQFAIFKALDSMSSAGVSPVFSFLPLLPFGFFLMWEFWAWVTGRVLLVAWLSKRPCSVWLAWTGLPLLLWRSVLVALYIPKILIRQLFWNT